MVYLIFFSVTNMRYLCVCTQEEEEGTDEDHPKQRSPKQQKLWLKPHRCVSPDEVLHLPPLETSETPQVSPLEEVKGFQPQIITMATLHEASRYSVCAQLQHATVEGNGFCNFYQESQDFYLFSSSSYFLLQQKKVIIKVFFQQLKPCSGVLQPFVVIVTVNVSAHNYRQFKKI